LLYRAHVVQDVIPYSCIIDDCDTPDEMYLTAESLLAHMLEKHSVTRWSCDYCAYGADKSKESADEELQQFDTAEEWESHIAAKHGDTIPVSQRAILAELNKQPMIGPLFCSLCPFTTMSMDMKIDDHILKHLHEFALRALPEGARETDDQGSKTSQASGLLSHTQSNSVDAAIAREYPIVTLQEVKYAMDNAWDLFSTSGTASPQPGLKWPLHSDAAATELWQTKSRQLKEMLDALKFIYQDNMRWEHPYILDVVVEAVDEMNSAAVANAQPLPFNQSKRFPLPRVMFTICTIQSHLANKLQPILSDTYLCHPHPHMFLAATIYWMVYCTNSKIFSLSPTKASDNNRE
jgi:hypothetical protein